MTDIEIPSKLIEDFKAGMSVADIARALEQPRRQVRRALVKAVGGKSKYAALREKGAGFGATVSKKEKKGKDRIPMDRRIKKMVDKDVKNGAKVISGTPYAKGWKGKTLWLYVGGPRLKGVDRYEPYISDTLIISPKGNEYVMAQDNERADLIVISKKKIHRGIGPIRLKKFEGSVIGRMAVKTEKFDEHIEASQNRQKAKRRKKRIKRKTN